jgi:phosphoglycerate kinase
MEMMKSIKEADLKNKTVILRTNFDVPIKNGRILDDSKIRESARTIKYLLRNKAKVLIVAHLGRPEKRDNNFSLKPVALRLKKILKKPVIFMSDILEEGVEEKIKKSDHKAVILFENMRFYEEETANNYNFAQQISKLADYFVNDDFPTSHHINASFEAITRFLPSFCGLSFEKEIKELSKIKDEPHHPFAVIIGGIKVSDKISVILNLAKKADYILIGGAAANSFLKEKGYKLGDSLVDEKSLKEVSKILQNVSSKIVLPIDVIIASSLNARKHEVVDIPSIPSEICESPYAIYDIGPKTLIKWTDIIKTARTIFWSGPLGAFEYNSFSEGTRIIARAVSRNKNETVVGGGDTIDALSMFKIKRFTHISTAGGAMLEYVAGEELPGLEALERNNPTLKNLSTGLRLRQ